MRTLNPSLSLSLSDALDLQAQGELRDSFLASLAKIDETPVEEIEDAYERINDSEGNHVKGIKRHRETGAIHLTAVVQAKRIITPGEYPAVKSKPLTLAKNAIKAQLPIAKWRQFKLTSDKVERISVDSLKLLPPV